MAELREPVYRASNRDVIAYLGMSDVDELISLAHVALGPEAREQVVGGSGLTQAQVELLRLVGHVLYKNKMLAPEFDFAITLPMEDAEDRSGT